MNGCMSSSCQIDDQQNCPPVQSSCLRRNLSDYDVSLALSNAFSTLNVINRCFAALEDKMATTSTLLRRFRFDDRLNGECDYKNEVGQEHPTVKKYAAGTAKP